MITPLPTPYVRLSCQSPARWSLSCLALICAALAAPLSAQETTGTITGTVADVTTGKFLEGAEVSLKGTSLTTTSAREGVFALRDVPVGAQTVVVTYPSLEPQFLPVTVTGGVTPPLAVKLTGGTIQLSEYRVSGAKEGMSMAVALQKESVNAKVVAASDQYGDIAEGNAAEYLKFLPGVGIDYNANDARAVTLRGMSTAFTNVTVNGDPIASATSGNLNRRFEFEQEAINNVETIEVIKTLTPELQANSTAGEINFVTKSALDREDNLMTYRVYFQGDNSDLYWNKSEGWGQEQTRKILPGVDVNYAYHITKNLGIDIGYKNSQLFNDYPRSQYTWEYNPANGGSPTAPALTSWNLQNEQKDTRRQAFSTQLDYKPDDNTKISALGDWSFYDLLFTDRTTTVNTGALAPLATTSASAVQNGTVKGLPGKGSVTFQTINRWKSGVTWDFPLTVSHDFQNGSTVDGSAYWSQAYSKYRDSTGGWYSDATMSRTNLTVEFDNVGAVAPSYRVTDSTGNVVDLRDDSQFAVTQIRSRPQTGVDTRSGYTGDYKFDLKTTIPITVKFGGRVDYSTRNISDPIYNRTAFSPAINGAALTALNDVGFSQHSIGYGLPAYNFISLYAAYTQLGGLNYIPYTPASDIQARFDDTTWGGYARLDITPIKNLLVSGGVRREDRETDTQNRLTTLPAPILTKFTDNSWFPSVNIKYTPTRNLVFRLGYAKSIGLPDYSDLLPGPATATDPTGSTRGKISIYNPDLQAYRINNFDAGLEYYFNSSGYVAVSVFRKDLTNYIITATQGLTPASAALLGINTATLGAAVDQYDVTYKFNVPQAGHYNGIEFGFSQNLSFLPKPFNTLGIQANATLLSIDPIQSNAVFSSTDAALNATILQQINLNLSLAAVKQSYNVTLNYSYGRFGFNVVTNYTGNVLKLVSQKTVKYSDVATNNYYNELQYQAPRELVDVRVDYKLNPKLTPYFQVRNIFGRPIEMSTQMLPFNHAEYGDPIFEIGLRGVY